MRDAYSFLAPTLRRARRSETMAVSDGEAIDTQPLPLVTVIMPVRNEVTYIGRSLGAVLRQTYPPERLEVFVVDGRSDDGTLDVIERLLLSPPGVTFCVSDGCRVRVLDNPPRIVPTALNIGLDAARGDVVIRVDGHCEIADNYVSCCVRALAERNAECVGGPIETVGETLTAQAIALAQSSWFGVGNAAFRTGSKKGRFVDTVAFGAYRASVFSRIGRFDEGLVRNQDDEFNFRLTQAGGKIWLDPSIRSIYYSRSSLRGLWRQYFLYGFYKVGVIQRRRGLPSWRQVVPAVLVVMSLASFLWTVLSRDYLWAVGVMLPYLGANATASAWNARGNLRALPLLPLAYSCLHFSYGLGFLWGFLRWRGH